MPLPLTPRARKILELSEVIADAQGCEYVGSEHLLLAVIAEDGPMASLLRRADATEKIRYELVPKKDVET